MNNFKKIIVFLIPFLFFVSTSKALEVQEKLNYVDDKTLVVNKDYYKSIITDQQKKALNDTIKHYQDKKVNFFVTYYPMYDMFQLNYLNDFNANYSLVSTNVGLALYSNNTSSIQINGAICNFYFSNLNYTDCDKMIDDKVNYYNSMFYYHLPDTFLYFSSFDNLSLNLEYGSQKFDKISILENGIFKPISSTNDFNNYTNLPTLNIVHKDYSSKIIDGKSLIYEEKLGFEFSNVDFKKYSYLYSLDDKTTWFEISEKNYKTFDIRVLENKKIYAKVVEKTNGNLINENEYKVTQISKRDEGAISSIGDIFQNVLDGEYNFMGIDGFKNLFGDVGKYSTSYIFDYFPFIHQIKSIFDVFVSQSDPQQCWTWIGDGTYRIDYCTPRINIDLSFFGGSSENDFDFSFLFDNIELREKLFFWIRLTLYSYTLFALWKEIATLFQNKK